MSNRLRVAVLYGGPSAEHEVSVVSARHVIAAMDPARYEVVPIAVTKQGRWLLPAKTPAELTAPAGALPAVGDEGTEVLLVPEAGSDRSQLVAFRRPVGVFGSIDVVFPVLHGPGGEDGTVQGLLELAGLPYVGAGVAASAVGMDKELQKLVCAARGLPVCRFTVVHEHEWRRGDSAARAAAVAGEVGLPCFTKPANLGSSVGISKCRTEQELIAGVEEALRHDRKVVVEEAVDARELECAVLGNDEPEASVVGEIVPAHEFYDYEAKYLEEGSELRIPADVPPEVAEEVRRLAVAAFRAIGCAGMARVDFFLDRRTNRVLLNEVNTIPGFTPISMYPKLWQASGVSYGDLIDRLIELALERHKR